MQRYYGCDLTASMEHMSLRRLCVLVRGLPPDSAVMRDGKAWTQDRELLAEIVEHVDYWGRVNAFSVFAANAKPADRKKFVADLKPPTVLEHPERGQGEQSEHRPAPKVSSAQEASMFFAKLGKG